MKTVVRGNEVFAATGGRAHSATRPWLIFLHGSGQSSMTWTQQSRTFAYDGFNVAALDFPGHGQSEGEPLTTIEAMADWVIDFMDKMEIVSAHIVGHSQGCLTAIELGARYPERVSSIAFIAGAGAIPVNPALVGMAETKEPKAIGAMLSWGFGNLAHHHDNTVPGASHIHSGTRVMASNKAGALACDLKACNAYEVGLEQAAKINAPTVCILAGADKMTPLKAGKQLVEALSDTTLSVVEGAGHMLPGEHPFEVNAALRAFYKKIQ